jgi:putative lipoprotein
VRILKARLVPAALLVTTAALLAIACAQPKGPHGSANVAGTITYRERIALPKSARVEIQLVDATDTNETSPLIAERLIDQPGQVPIAFSLAYDPATVKTNRTYALRVRIRVGDDVWFASPFDLRVLTQGNPDQVEVQLDRVSAGGAMHDSVLPRNTDPDPPNLDPRVKSARDDARGIDARLDRLDMREVTDGPERKGFEPRRLRLWIRDDVPVKLTVTEAGPVARRPATSSYYFRDGQLFWVRASDGGYLFEGGTLSVWLDGQLHPAADTGADAAQHHQTRVRAELRSALATFGVE